MRDVLKQMLFASASRAAAFERSEQSRAAREQASSLIASMSREAADRVVAATKVLGTGRRGRRATAAIIRRDAKRRTSALIDEARRALDAERRDEGWIRRSRKRALRGVDRPPFGVRPDFWKAVREEAGLE